MENNTILVIDDDRNILAILELYLKKAGFQVATCADGAMALAAFHETRPALVVLDVMLPGRDGWSVLHDIRMEGETPVIMLTAKGEEVDKLLGFALGADDYIVKPFSPREIVSRIQVIFRRMNQMQSEPEQGRLVVGNTVIDLRCYEVRVGEETVLLSPKEVEILHLMASHARQVFTREQLLDNIWGFDFNGDPRVVDTSIKRIRKKLPENTDVLLRSVYGVGYKVEVRGDA